MTIVQLLPGHRCATRLGLLALSCINNQQGWCARMQVRMQIQINVRFTRFAQTPHPSCTREAQRRGLRCPESAARTEEQAAAVIMHGVSATCRWQQTQVVPQSR